MTHRWKSATPVAVKGYNDPEGRLMEELTLPWPEEEESQKLVEEHAEVTRMPPSYERVAAGLLVTFEMARVWGQIARLERSPEAIAQCAALEAHITALSHGSA